MADFTAGVNRARARAGLPAISVDPRLAAAARQQAAFMAESGRLTHAGAGGSTTGTRATAQGYEWGLVAENIAVGSASEGAALRLWMDSAPHRANILDGRFDQYGLARSGGYWAMVLGDPR
ncbi:MAG: CAP domain-containing protein [Paracoccaceae bacterium]